MNEPAHKPSLFDEGPFVVLFALCIFMGFLLHRADELLAKAAARLYEAEEQGQRATLAMQRLRVSCYQYDIIPGDWGDTPANAQATAPFLPGNAGWTDWTIPLVPRPELVDAGALSGDMFTEPSARCWGSGQNVRCGKGLQAKPGEEHRHVDMIDIPWPCTEPR